MKGGDGSVWGEQFLFSIFPFRPSWKLVEVEP
jgi:hypothetical protein